MAIVHDVSDNYFNVATLVHALDLLTFKFSFASNLKMLNNTLGIQSYASSFPCSWCGGKSPGKPKVDQGSWKHSEAKPRHSKMLERINQKAKNKSVIKLQSCILLLLYNGTWCWVPQTNSLMTLTEHGNSAWGDSLAYK